MVQRQHQTFSGNIIIECPRDRYRVGQSVRQARRRRSFTAGVNLLTHLLSVLDHASLRRWPCRSLRLASRLRLRGRTDAAGRAGAPSACRACRCRQAASSHGSAAALARPGAADTITVRHKLPPHLFVARGLCWFIVRGTDPEPIASRCSSSHAYMRRTPRISAPSPVICPFAELQVIKTFLNARVKPIQASSNCQALYGARYQARGYTKEGQIRSKS
jgi:hypothetical protein